MRVLVCPDSFTGTMSAAGAAEAIIAGWRATSPDDDLAARPLSDGGPGFLAAVASGQSGVHWRTATVTGPLGEPVGAEWLTTQDGTAWIESAEAAGLSLMPDDQRDPTRTTTRGVGELIGAAVAAGCERIVVGVGGTGTCDGGAGLLAALGATAVGAEGRVPLDRGGLGLAAVTGLDVAPALAAIANVPLSVATDVDVPLLGPRGAAHGFAAQKGASPGQVEALEAALTTWAALLGRDDQGRSAGVALGAGAGGGLGAALIRLGAARVPGIATVIDAAGIPEALDGADLVITGEGAFDWQSLRGKVVAGVAAAALERAVPVLVLAGRVEVSRREWIGAGISAAFPAAPEPGQTPADALARAAGRAARTWSRR